MSAVEHRISGETRLNTVLDTIPGAVDFIVALNPHDFARLRHPTMRRVMAPRISLRRVAAMAGRSEAELLQGLAALGGRVAEPADHPPALLPPQSPTLPPPWMLGVVDAAITWVDLRALDDRQGDPFPLVSMAVKALPAGTVLGIRHRWQPQPLYDVWARMGIAWFARQSAPDEWQIYVYKPPGFRRKYLRPPSAEEETYE